MRPDSETAGLLHLPSHAMQAVTQKNSVQARSLVTLAKRTPGHFFNDDSDEDVGSETRHTLGRGARKSSVEYGRDTDK